MGMKERGLIIFSIAKVLFWSYTTRNENGAQQLSSEDFCSWTVRLCFVIIDNEEEKFFLLLICIIHSGVPVKMRDSHEWQEL